jgi:AraC family transcriptional regulator
MADSDAAMYEPVATAANVAPSTPARDCPCAGISIVLFSAPAGVTTLRPIEDHLLTIHVGAPVRVACRYDGRSHRRLQSHGDIEVVPAGMSGVWEDATPSTALSLRLSPALIGAAATGLGLNPDRIVVEPRYQLRDPQIEHIGWALKAEMESGYPGGRLYAESLGLAMATCLLRLSGSSPAQTPRHGLSGQQLRHVIDYIEVHLDRDLSLGQLAGVAGVSPSHFKALFRQSLGIPVHQYVVRCRIERARNLLLEGKLAMSQVALVTGFADQSHMARWMRRLHGVTPTDVTRSRR